MSIAEKSTRKCIPLESGDRLTRAEFERRYSARPDIKKAELIEGVVYVASPVSTEEHGTPHFHLAPWLGVFVAKTPGVIPAIDSTVRLDTDNEVQPDLFLALDRDHGGGAALAEGYLEGAPDLVVEVAASSASHDLNAKMHVYRRNGVREYLVWQIYEGRLDWFRLNAEGVYETVPAGAAGVIESEVFPGLRLDVPALLRGDLAAVIAAVG
ncbi:MAG: Uma2 family endonuclease [Chloroflexi bacterium]|nr:Uma2 family endonuclease [Chloroflexota bacterium]